MKEGERHPFLKDDWADIHFFHPTFPHDRERQTGDIVYRLLRGNCDEGGRHIVRREMLWLVIESDAQMCFPTLLFHHAVGPALGRSFAER